MSRVWLVAVAKSYTLASVRPWLLLFIAAACAKPEIDPALQIDGLYLAARTAFAQGDYKKAHAQFAELERLSPGDPRLPEAKGELFLAETKLTEALQSFEQAARLQPNRASTWSRMGFLLRLRGEKQRAREALEKAISLNAADLNAYEQLGELALQEGNVQQAAGFFVKAAQLSKDSNAAELYLRAAQELERGGSSDQALSTLEQAADAGVRAGELSTQRGELLVRKGRLAEAVEAFREAATGSTDPTLLELVGELEAKLGRPSEAKAAFEKSLLVKDRAVVHVALARLCLERKDQPCAQKELDLALASASGEELRESLELAELLERLGRANDAVTLLAEVSNEPERIKDQALQLRLARLAKKTGAKEVLGQACGRALDAGVPRCP